MAKTRQVRDTSASSGSSSCSGLWWCAGAESPADSAEISRHSLDDKQDEGGRIFPGVGLPVDSADGMLNMLLRAIRGSETFVYWYDSKLANDFNTNNDQICPKLFPPAGYFETQYWLRTIIYYVIILEYM